MKDFLTLAHDRYSVRKISSRPVEREKLEKIIEAGLIAPTAANRMPAKVFLFTSKEAKEKLDSVHHFPFVKSAPAVFVVAAVPDTAWVRPFDRKNFADVDASIVATQMMLEIHDLGLGSTWCGYFDEAKLKELFPELKGLDLIALFPVGYIEEGCEPAEAHEKYLPMNEFFKEF